MAEIGNLAAWQFAFRAVPQIGIEREFGTVPLALPPDRTDDQRFWGGISLTPALKIQISKILPRLVSWHAELEQWGYQDGNRIDISTDNGTIVDFAVRVDVREDSQVFLIGILGIARRHGWLMCGNDGQLMRPYLSRVLSKIRTSQAFCFVQNPEKFFEALSAERDQEEDG